MVYKSFKPPPLTHLTQIGLRNFLFLTLVLDSLLIVVKLYRHIKFQLPRRCISDLTLSPPSKTDRLKNLRGSNCGSGLTFFRGASLSRSGCDTQSVSQSASQSVRVLTNPMFIVNLEVLMDIGVCKDNMQSHGKPYKVIQSHAKVFKVM